LALGWKGGGRFSPEALSGSEDPDGDLGQRLQAIRKCRARLLSKGSSERIATTGRLTWNFPKGLAGDGDNGQKFRTSVQQ
jgi:hypothetical protein